MMLTFRTAEGLSHRIACLGAKIEGDSFPLSIKMPCKFAIVKDGRKVFGKAGQYLIFTDAKTPEISDCKAEEKQPEVPEKKKTVKPKE
jgi:hypothetical protein